MIQFYFLMIDKLFGLFATGFHKRLKCYQKSQYLTLAGYSLKQWECF
jgi:hypothetical protein